MSNIAAGAEIGTNTSKVMILKAGKIFHSASDIYHPDHPWEKASRQNPKVWLDAFRQAHGRACNEACISGGDIGAEALGGQMHGLAPDDEEANLWNDSSAGDDVDAAEVKNTLLKRGINVLEETGNELSPNLTLMKLLQMRKINKSKFNNMEKFTLPAGYIIRQLIGEAVIDPSDASGTQLWDINNRTWSDKIFEALEIPKNIRPRLVESLDVAGKVKDHAARASGLAHPS